MNLRERFRIKFYRYGETQPWATADEISDWFESEQKALAEEIISEIPDDSGNWDDLKTMSSNKYLKDQLKQKYLKQ